MKRRRRKGFTLIELVVVIAILALLMAIAIPTYSNYRETAEEQAFIANERMLKNAAILYMSETGSESVSWPDDAGECKKYVETWPKGYAISGSFDNLTVTNASETE